MFAAAPGRSSAQGVISPAGPNGFLRALPVYREQGYSPHHVIIPRTYSYQYQYRYNQPRHYRVVGRDGKTYWRSTVRDRPMGIR
jgi:hypothetical protein